MSGQSTKADDVPTDTPQPAVRELAGIRHALVALIIMSAIVACYFAKDVILPLVLGVMIALTLSPAVRTGGRLGVPPALSAVVLIVLTAGIVGIGAYAVSGPVSSWVAEAPQLGQTLRVRLEGVFRSVEQVQQASKQVEDATTSAAGGEVQKVAIQQPGFLSSAVSNAASAATTIAVALVLALFLLASGDMFYVKMVEAMPRLSDKKRALKIVYGIERSISRYLLTITIINAGLGVAIGTVLTLIGLPLGWVWGIVAFLLNFLPFIGAVVGVGLVAAYAIVTVGPLGWALLSPALYLCCTTLEGNFITPLILGRRMELNTVSVFVTVVFWGWLWGIAGALMAVPFLVILKVVANNVPGLATLGNFLGSSRTRPVDEVTAPPEAAT